MSLRLHPDGAGAAIVAWCAVQPPNAGVRRAARIFHNLNRCPRPGVLRPNRSFRKDVVCAVAVDHLSQDAWVPRVFLLSLLLLVEFMLDNIVFNCFRYLILHRSAFRDTLTQVCCGDFQLRGWHREQVLLERG